MLSRSHLEELSLTCRNLAQQAVDDASRASLLSLADEYERRAKAAPDTSMVVEYKRPLFDEVFDPRDELTVPMEKLIPPTS